MRGVRRRLLALGAATATAVGVACAGSAGASAPRVPPPAQVSVVRQFGGPIHSIVIGQAYLNAQPQDRLLELRHYRQIGFNTVTMYVGLTQDTPTSSSVYRGPYDVSPAALQLATEQAHAQGLHVVWAPVPHANSDDATWRGAYHPSSVNRWFASYAGQLGRLAALAQAEHVEMFEVGSELHSLEPFTGGWRAVVARVRSVYTGAVTYMARPVDVPGVRWWDALDAVSISPYWSLSSARTPSYGEMYTNWVRGYLPQVWRLAVSYNRPVLFGEIGYRSRTQTALNPWMGGGWTLPTDADQVGQANAYAALLQAAALGGTWMPGVTLWLDDSRSTPSPLSTDWTPMGKEAECVVAELWGRINPDALRSPSGTTLAMPQCAASAPLAALNREMGLP